VVAITAQKWKANADRWWIYGLSALGGLLVVIVLLALQLPADGFITTTGLLVIVASATFQAGWWLGERERLTGAINFRSKSRPKDL
jgi:hypothetical protein